MGGGILLAAALTFTSLPSAFADDGQNEADSTAAAIAAVAPDTQSTVTSTVGDTGPTATTGGIAVSLPSTSDGVVTLSSTDPSQQVSSPVTISLPKEITGKHAAKSNKGILVYSDRNQAADAAAQELSNGSVRLQTVTFSAKGTQKFTYTIGNATPVLQDDGSVALVQTIPSDGGLVQQIVATIAPAWARSADGSAVATHYEIKGNGQLVQVIKPDKATKYPVVADPQVSIQWYGYLVQFNRNETNNLALGYTVASILGGVLAKIPVGLAVFVGSGVYAAVASWAYNAGGCLQITLIGPLGVGPNVPSRYFGGYCR